MMSAPSTVLRIITLYKLSSDEDFAIGVDATRPGGVLRRLFGYSQWLSPTARCEQSMGVCMISHTYAHFV
jgi:hypothetical protein